MGGCYRVIVLFVFLFGCIIAIAALPQIAQDEMTRNIIGLLIFLTFIGILVGWWKLEQAIDLGEMRHSQYQYQNYAQGVQQEEGQKWAWLAAHDQALIREGRAPYHGIAYHWARSHADKATFALLNGKSTEQLEAIATQYGAKELRPQIHPDAWYENED